MLQDLVFIVLVKWSKLLLDHEVIEQLAACSGILRKDKINGPEHFQGTQSNILEITYGSGNNIQHGKIDRQLLPPAV
jgi:hypothetical protein